MTHAVLHDVVQGGKAGLTGASVNKAVCSFRSTIKRRGDMQTVLVQNIPRLLHKADALALILVISMEET